MTGRCAHEGPLTLDGLRMRAVATGTGGEVYRDTLFVFAQERGCRIARPPVS